MVMRRMRRMSDEDEEEEEAVSFSSCYPGRVGCWMCRDRT